MRTPEEEILSEKELNEMLNVWAVPAVPSDKLRARIFAKPPQNRWSFAGLWERRCPVMLSVLVHATALAMVFTVVQNPAIKKKVQDTKLIYLPAFHPHRTPAANVAQGGGGAHDLSAHLAQAPHFASKQFVAPAPPVLQPQLPVVPTISAEAPPLIASNDYGDPLSNMKDGGLGLGNGTGIGNGTGSGWGAGHGGNIGDGTYKIGGDVSSPIAILKPEPEYSEEARKAKYQGGVLLSIVVDEHGVPRNIKVIRALGLGLDEKAIEAVSRWRFRPGLRQGKPVAVQAQVEVTFRLL